MKDNFARRDKNQDELVVLENKIFRRLACQATCQIIFCPRRVLHFKMCFIKDSGLFLPDARAGWHLDLEVRRSLLDKSRAATLSSCVGQGKHFLIDHCEACYYLVANDGEDLYELIELT